MSKVIVIGGGPAGMFAAINAAKCGHEVHLFEGNDKLGKKLFITGKGRCNVTNAADMDTLFSSVISNRKFTYSCFYSFTNQDIMDFFENAGVPLKVERGNRVFPVSDHSFDIIRALKNELELAGVFVHLCSKVTKIVEKEKKFDHICLADNRSFYADSCIVATGGLSYPTTGSTGDGYTFAKSVGHTVTKCLPSLVPMNVKEAWVKEMQGLSLRNITVTVCEDNKLLYQEFGEMMFTHFGVTGPLILSASSTIGERLKEKNLILEIDLKPALSAEKLDARILREFDENKNRQFKNVIQKLLPSKMIPVFLSLSEIPEDKKVNEISKAERQALVYLLKHFRITLTGLRDFNEAIITKGGVSVKEINPATMESKLIKNLYFSGEVLDLDALTGGFNLQIAWSTAYLAGTSIEYV